MPRKTSLRVRLALRYCRLDYKAFSPTGGVIKPISSIFTKITAISTIAFIISQGPRPIVRLNR